MGSPQESSQPLSDATSRQTFGVPTLLYYVFVPLGAVASALLTLILALNANTETNMEKQLQVQVESLEDRIEDAREAQDQLFIEHNKDVHAGAMTMQIYELLQTRQEQDYARQIGALERQVAEIRNLLHIRTGDFRQRGPYDMRQPCTGQK